MQLFFCSFLVAILIFGVGRVKAGEGYIIPDIGAPGMNIYVECVASPSARVFFGEDGIYEGKKETLLTARLVAKKGSLPCEIDIAPCIVTWDGRLLSTQIFIGSECKPNSSDVRQLDSIWQLEFVVFKSMQVVATYDFYIVKPWAIGDLSHSEEHILGAGNLGRRSPRGAMIVDSLILRAGTTYRVATEDTSPAEAGNQGYLPFTLIAEGRVGCDAGMAAIDVSGSSQGGRGNGGPGGGGGGGSYYDAPLHNTNPFFGAEGGDGFTGGGSGGFNKGSSLLKRSQQLYNKAGDGSGSSGQGNPSGGSSLNGVAGAFAEPGIFENGGGGTGHPFGVSGRAAFQQDDDTQQGGTGGGSGASNLLNGGGGGYATDGGTPIADVGGKKHGNPMIVPLAGGSGGASGNPRAAILLSSRGGYGGGGGGAIALSARALDNILIRAEGGLARLSDADAFGGHGSGGAILLNTKTLLRNVHFQAAGKDVPPATPSGDGYVRINGFGRGLSSSLTATMPFVGVATDTTSVAGRSFSLTMQAGAKETRLLYKPKGRNVLWKEMKTVKKEIFNNYLSLTCYVEGLEQHDTTLYIVAVQPVEEALHFLAGEGKVSHIYSQAGANILRFLPENTLHLSVVDSLAAALLCEIITYDSLIECGVLPSVATLRAMLPSLADTTFVSNDEVFAEFLEEQNEQPESRQEPAKTEHEVLRVAIHPNPARDIANIATATRSSFRCIVRDIKGRVMFSQPETKRQREELSLDVSRWAAGAYYVEIEDEKGQKATQLFVVRR